MVYYNQKKNSNIPKIKVLLSNIFFASALVFFLLNFGLLTSCNAQIPEENNVIKTHLNTTWRFFKQRHMPDGAHVISNNYGGTITEGQSYAMMKALWLNDPVIFDKTWRWTLQNMKRPGDNLFGWQWGQKKGTKTYGILDENSAPDGDEDIAYTLILASEKWNQPQYLQAAKKIIADFWRLNVREVNGRYFVGPGTWEGFTEQGRLNINPSYFAPYVYRKFAQVDLARKDQWLKLANDIYPTLESCTNFSTIGLPPNWCSVLLKNTPGKGPQIFPTTLNWQGAQDFGFDAFRVFWRMAMDARLGSPQARQYLQQHQYLLTYWTQFETLPQGFQRNGTPNDTTPSGFVNSALMTQMIILQPGHTLKWYKRLYLPLEHPEGYWMNDYDNYLHSVMMLALFPAVIEP